MSLLKLYPRNFFSAHCCKFPLDDGISRALSSSSSSSSSSPVLRGSISAALFERVVVCTSRENTSEDKCLFFFEQTNTKSN